MSLSPTATLVDVSPIDLKHSYSADEASFYPRDLMSLSGTNDFPFLLDTTTPTTASSKQATFAFPSPPPSIHASDSGLDFDLDSFAHCSPASDAAFGLITTPTSSKNVISPKTVSVAQVPAPLPASAFSSLTGSGFDSKVYGDISGSTDFLAVEALSNHHLQRYFHYKALAAQAEAEAAAAASQHAFGQMYPPIGPSSQSVYGVSAPAQHQFHPVPFPAPSVAAQQQQVAAAAMHAQANAHMQAHDAALAQVQQQRNMPMNYYMPTTQRASFESMGASQPMWSRQSITSSVTSPPYPSTPNFSQAALPQMMSKTTTSTSLPGVPLAPLVHTSRSLSEGEAEMEDELDGSDDDDESTSIPSMAVANPHGGGRGYVPGKTPDDPKKRHKCNVCGRGFARAFNLKVCFFPF